MSPHIPTETGDVLILQTKSSYTVFAVGVVTEDSQQSFDHQVDTTKHVADRVSAIRLGKTLLAPGHRVFLADYDTGEWAEISQ